MPYKEILGHERPKHLLKAALKSRRLHHAYLFWGPEGVGKRTMAQALAQALNCPQAQDGDACGQCLSCRKIAKGIHPDYLCLEIEEKKTEIGIKQVTEVLQPFLAYKPYEGLRKVAVVGEARKMSEEAANALLKLLEEPPAQSHIILVTPSPFALLPTIVSRCQPISFAPLAISVLEKELERRLKIPPEEAVLLAGLAEGSLGAALNLDPKTLRRERAETLEAWEQVEKEKLSWTQDLAEDWGKEREPALERLRLLMLWHRDLLAASFSAPAPLLFNQDQAEKLCQQARQHSSREWLRRLILLRRTYEAVERFANVKLAWGALFVEVRSRL